MPPKKKKAKESSGGGSGGGGSKGDKDDEVTTLKDLAENAMLRQRMETFQMKSELLYRENEELKATVKKMTEDQEDIFRHLNGEIATLKESNAQIQSELDKFIADNNLLVTELKKQHEEDKLEHESQIMQMEAELASTKEELGKLTEFKAKKTDLENELLELGKALEREKRDHRQTTYDMERRLLQEKDRLKKEMESRLEDTKTMFIRMTGRQLEATTKRTIMENDKMSSELAYQSRETEKLLGLTTKLSEENLQLKRQSELAEDAEKKLVKQNHAYVSTINKLVERLKEVEGEVKVLQKAQLTQEMDLVAKYERQLDAIRRECEFYQRQRDEQKEIAASVQGELQRIQSLKDEVARFLLQCMNDMKMQLAKIPRGSSNSNYDNNNDDIENAGPEVFEFTTDKPLPRLDDLPADERDKVLRVLFSKLSAFRVMRKDATKPEIPMPNSALFPPIPPTDGKSPMASSKPRHLQRRELY